MAMSKATVKPTAKVQAKVEEAKKAEVKPVEVKAEQMKLDVTEPKKAVEKVADKVVEAKKAVEEKAETVKKAAEEKKAAAAKKAPAKKTATAKKTTTKTAAKSAAKKAPKKEAVKASVHVQANGNSYEIDDLVKITKDIWKYDFNKKISEFKSVDIYVKLEDKTAYYVINGEITGSFPLN